MAKPAATVSGLRPYAAYKPSGMEWLGEVPAHWEVLQIGRMGTLSKGNGGSKADEAPVGIPCVRYGDLYTTHSRFVRSSRAFVSVARAADYTPLKHGDVLFAASGETVDEIGKSAVNLMLSEACCGGDIIVFRPKHRTHAPFMGYVTDCWSSATQKSMMGKGFTVVHIYESQLKELVLPVPPVPEQAAIARYLDHADRSIRRCIQAKVKLVELLEEQRQAIINEAVTGRVDVRSGKPYLAYKPSGVEWLGDMPAHWEIVRNGQIFFQRNETGFPQLPVLEVSLNTGVRIRNLETPERKQIMTDRSDYKRATKGDLAYNMMRMWQGAVGVTPVDGLVSPAYVVASPRRGTEPRFFCALFRTREYMAEVDKHSRGIVKDRNRLYWIDFKQMSSPCPPTEEQIAIASHLDCTNQRIQRCIQSAKRQVQLLEEYRTRLITDLVTGKLDVREVAARLRDRLEESCAPSKPDAPTRVDPNTAESPGASAWEPETCP